MHYYYFHIGDYVTHTRHLTLIEDLAFRRLLDFYYLHEQPIRQHEIARQIGMREHEQEILSVLEEFFVSTESGYINPRADREIAKYREMSEAGKRGAAIRWAKGGDSPPIAPPIATNNQEPITNNHIKAPKVACPVDISKEVWDSFVALRKAKKAPVTDLVVETIRKEAGKVNWSLQEAMQEMAVRNWQGFKAEWVPAKTLPTNGVDPALKKIKEDAKAATPMPEAVRALIRNVGRVQ